MTEGTAARVARAGLIAAVYVAATWVLAPISFGPLQFRLAEVLVLLPVLWPEAVPGLWLGCLIANSLFGGLGPWDIYGGSAITGVAAYLTWRLRGSWLALTPPVVLNGLLVSAYLAPIFHVPYWPTVAAICASEAIIVLGPAQWLVLALRRAVYPAGARH